MTSIFINRPILSVVISVFIIVLGILALSQLPMTQFPDIAPTEVTVTAKYTGANALTCTKAVVTPLERAINGVPGMSYMSSVSGNDGTSVIQLIFKAGTDPEVASVNVQNRVASVLDELPEEVIKSGVIVEKVVNSMLMYINLMSTDDELDELFLYNFTDINLLAELRRIDGVGFADIMGSREYSMRVWLKPDRMLAYNVSAEDVIESLQSQNIEAAPGKIGESSDRKAQSLQYVIRYTGKYNTEAQYENVVIRANADGETLRLKDIAEVEFGSQDYDVLSKEKGRPSAAIMLKQRAGSNARKVISDIKLKMEELKATSFPAGIDYTISYDVSRFLDASIDEVKKTLIEAFILVSLVVFIFLQDWRSTLIPAIAVPVSLIGTFFFMQMMGFSLNLITLFALVLSIGIVVDNAIVVVEAVHFKMEKLHLDARQATQEAMKEITGAIIAITLVMSAVFVPVAFMSGPSGIFYRQFSLTMAAAIVLSGVIAMTLTPALCALMLKSTHNESQGKNVLQRFFDVFNNWYNNLSLRYQNLLTTIANRRVITIGILFFFCMGTGLLGKTLSAGFIPNEDQGMFYAAVTTPSGSTLERTSLVVDEIQNAAEKMDMVSSVSTLAGFNILTDGTGATYGMCMINMKSWDDREESVAETIQLLREKTAHIKDATIEFFPPPAVPGYGNASGFELRLLDKTRSDDLNALQKTSTDFLKALNERAEIQNTFTSFDASFPQYMVHIDNDKAVQKGVAVDEALSNLQTLIGSFYATNFIRFGQMYKVMVQALPEYRAQPEDLLKLYVNNADGEPVPYSSFASIERVYGPDLLTRYNMYTSAMMNGESAPGYSSGSALKAVQEVAAETLPAGYDIDWAGVSRDEVLAGNEAIYIFMICLLFVYLLLAAQYESLLLPMPVILSLPTGIFGAFFFLMMLGLENNIYAQVAMIMLIGLLGKNAILIVEFASMKQKQGFTPMDSAIEAATSRLRPILMTSFAFIAGLIPLLFASGAGAVGNRTIGAAAAGGMLFGTIFGVIIIPGLYVLFASLSPTSAKQEFQKITVAPES